MQCSMQGGHIANDREWRKFQQKTGFVNCPPKVGHPTWGFFMAKYGSAFKQEVVAYYGDGERSYRDVGVRFGLDYSMVRRWVASHAAHGVAGLSAKHSHCDAHSGYLCSSECGRMACPVDRRQRCSIFAALAASRFGRGNMSAVGLKPWLRAEEAGPDPCPNHLSPSITDTVKDGPPDDEARSREELLAELAYLRMENAYLKKLEALTQARHALSGSKPSRR